jgi:hypothetical protein
MRRHGFGPCFVSGSVVEIERSGDACAVIVAKRNEYQQARFHDIDASEDEGCCYEAGDMVV